MKIKLISISLCFLSLLIAPVYFLHNKPVHVSIDDFYISLDEFNQNTAYKSVFDQALFKDLKQLNELTGVKIVLYTYAAAPPHYSIDSLPKKIVQEINENSEWLKLGFHAKSPNSHNNDFLEFYTGYQKFKETFSVSQSNYVRLHYFHAGTQEIELLKNNNVKTFLTADDNRISYGLPRKINDSLFHNQTIFLNDLTYKKTDFRIEKTFFPILNIWSCFLDDEIIFFTHEWALSPLNRFKFKVAIYYLSLYGCKFILD